MLGSMICAAFSVNFCMIGSIMEGVKLALYPPARLAKVTAIPATGCLEAERKSNAPMGIKNTYAAPLTMCAKIEIKITKGTTKDFGTKEDSFVKETLRKPLSSAMPIPRAATMVIASGGKLIKFSTILLSNSKKFSNNK